ncbi:MAG TPA: response regulator [Chitinophagaceae bacterium]
MTAKSRTILCVDDDPDDQYMVLQAIKELDPSALVITAFNGVGALEYLEAAARKGERPCLVILDINMPVMDGKQTLVRLKKDPSLQAIPVVLFTTSSSPLDRLFGEQYRAHFVTKPVRYLELLEKVKNLLRLCAAGDAGQ